MTLIALGLGINSLANVSFSVVLLWSFFFLPHAGMIPPLGGTIEVVLAVAQWTLVGLVVGRLVVGRKLIQAVVLTLTSMVVATVLAHVLIRTLGYQIVFEGP